MADREPIEFARSMLRPAPFLLGGFALMGVALLMVLVLPRIAPSGYAILGLLALAGGLLAFRIGGGRLRVGPDGFEVLEGGGSRKIPFDAVQSVGFDGVDAGIDDKHYHSGALLRTSDGDIHLAQYDGYQALYQAVEEEVLPGLATRHAAALAAGRTVEIEGITCDRQGFTLMGVRARWDELEGMVVNLDGHVVSFRGRPQDVVCVQPRECPALPTLLALATHVQDEGLAGTVGNAAGADESQAAAPSASTDEPLPGMQRQHPELGSLVFTRRVQLEGKAAFWFLVFAVLLQLGGVVAYMEGAPVPDANTKPEIWLILPGVVLLIAALIWGLSPAGGDEFCVYEQGMLDEDGKRLRFDDVDELELGATRVFVNGGYTGTNYVITISGRGTRFRVLGSGPKTEAMFDWFRDRLAPRLATRDLGAVQAGRIVHYGDLQLTSEGIRLPYGRLLAWKGYRGHSVTEGVLSVLGPGGPDDTVARLELTKPNAHIFWILLQLFEEQARAGAAGEAG